MSQDRIPYISPFFFFHQATAGGRRLFILLTLFSVLAAAYTWWAYERPYSWYVDLHQVTEDTQQTIALGSVRQMHRELPVLSPIYVQYGTFVPGPILPDPFAVYGFLFFTIAGWAAILTAGAAGSVTLASLLGGLFVLWLVLSGVFRDLLPGVPYAGAAIAAIPPAVLFVLHWFGKWNAGCFGRFIMNFTWLALMLGWVYHKEGFPGIHRCSANQFIPSLLLLLGFLAFSARSVINAWLLISSNRKNPSHRVKGPYVIAVWAVLLMVQAWILVELYLFSDFNAGVVLKPIHFMLIAFLTAVATSQHFLHQVKGYFNDSFAFTVLILGWGLAAIPFLGFQHLMGDFMFSLALMRIGMAIIAAATLFQFVYVLINLWPQIRARQAYYYTIMQPQNVSYFFVWAMIFFSIMVLEGQEHFTSRNFLLASYLNRQADAEMVEGNAKSAIENYRISYLMLQTDVKSNYNLASLLLAERKTDSVFLHLEAADDYLKFPYAGINAANILTGVKMHRMAANWLASAWKVQPDPYIGNNLAMIYVRLGKPDSAIYYLKQSAVLSPDISLLYANLGRIYMENGHPDAGEEILKTGLTCSNAGPVAITNAIAYTLSGDMDSLSLPEAWMGDSLVSANIPAMFNLAIWQIRNNNIVAARAWAASVLQRNEDPDALFADGLALMAMDSLELGRSRLEYTASMYPKFALISQYLIGVEYFQQHVPEMAGPFFRKSGELGLNIGYLYEACMDLDAGKVDSGYRKLGLVRAMYPEFFIEAGREAAIVLRSQGYAELALLDWDFQDATTDDYARMAWYATLTGKRNEALDAFRDWLRIDSVPEVYVMAGDLYLKLKDTLAVRDMEYARSLFPGDTALMVKTAEIYLAWERIQDAGKLILPLFTEDTASPEVRNVMAKYLLATGQPDSAANICLSLYEEFPYNTRFLRTLGEVFRTQGRYADGQALFYMAFTRNDKNPVIWYYMAVFQKGMNFSKDAAYSALKAIEFSTSEPDKLAIAAEFVQEIRDLGKE